MKHSVPVAVIVSVAAVGLLPWMRPVSEALRSRSMLIPTTLVLAAGFAAWVLVLCSRLAGSGQWGRLCVSMALFVGLVWGAAILAGHPEERIHFFVMAVVSGFWMRAWDNSRRPLWMAALAAAITTSAVGIIEENVQRFVPGRVFDWRDVWMNVLAAGISTLFWLTVRGSPRRCESTALPAAAE